MTSTFILRGRRGTYGTGLALAQLCVAGVALGDIHQRRRGTWRHPPSFCVARVALMALGWLWWRAWARLVAGDAAQLCVAGVALGDIHLRLA